MTPMPCFAQKGRISASMVRLIMEYGGCSEVMGAIFMRALHLRDGEVGDADLAHLALALQVGHRRPALFELLVRHRPVDLVQVDGLDAQALQAGLALLRESSSSSGRSCGLHPQVMELLVKM